MLGEGSACAVLWSAGALMAQPLDVAALDAYIYKARRIYSEVDG
jgi:hypothetical protein